MVYDKILYFNGLHKEKGGWHDLCIIFDLNTDYDANKGIQDQNKSIRQGWCRGWKHLPLLYIHYRWAKPL